jgi:methylated-DNA-[protein]-cysteine S-methyltransferase
MEPLAGRMVPSPVGQLSLVASDRGLVAVLWENDSPVRVRLAEVRKDAGANRFLAQAARELDEYFSGRRTAFSLALDFRGTEFQRQVWNALLTIPCGGTRTYAQVARQIGRPAAVRAVGAANGRNPVSIIVPCHRVVGSDGTLTGFAGGLDVKARLLALESSQAGCIRRRENSASGTAMAKNTTCPSSA